MIGRAFDDNAHSILGYIVCWIDQGVGWSKLPNINNAWLMEDLATLCIASQHMAHWLHHGIVSEAQIVETMRLKTTRPQRLRRWKQVI